jgi:lysophospholipase L1-like esterase
LGPKFEPWLDQDPSYKKKYAAMARAFRRGLEEYDTTTSFCNGNSAKRNDKHSDTGDRGGSNFDTHDRILFIDCLTMFCGETANLPGARLGGRARADPRFFASDQLHLSREGYEIWKEAVETGIERLLAPSKQDDP